MAVRKKNGRNRMETYIVKAAFRAHILNVYLGLYLGLNGDVETFLENVVWAEF